MEVVRLIRIVALLALMVGCGSITTTTSDRAVRADADVTEASVAPPPTDTRQGDLAVVLDGGSDDVGGGDGTTCIGGDGDVPGFAYNPGCDGGSTLPTSCHADCVLNGAHFVGCSVDSRVDAGYVVCHASCGECK